jgi:hypothetical protein
MIKRSYYSSSDTGCGETSCHVRHDYGRGYGLGIEHDHTTGYLSNHSQMIQKKKEHEFASVPVPPLPEAIHIGHLVGKGRGRDRHRLKKPVSGTVNGEA